MLVCIDLYCILQKLLKDCKVKFYAEHSMLNQQGHDRNIFRLLVCFGRK